MRKKQTRPRRGTLHPAYWPLLTAFGVLRVLSWLPFPLQFGLGRALGRLFMRLSARRRHIAATNIRLCFPELDLPARQALVRRHFESLGISLFEMALTWWSRDERLRRFPVTIEGGDNIRAGLQAGNGEILLGAHYTTMDIGLRLIIIHLYRDIFMTYRPHNDPILDVLITANRLRHGIGGSDYSDVRAMVRVLRDNQVMWQAPDQGVRGKMTEFVPFFGIPVSTLVATSRMAKMTGAAVVPFYVTRNPDDRGYSIKILPPLKDFPSDDPVADTTRINKLLEQHIREAPEQYLWVHRRFKYPAPGTPEPYGKKYGKQGDRHE